MIQRSNTIAFCLVIYHKTCFRTSFAQKKHPATSRGFRVTSRWSQDVKILLLPSLYSYLSSSKPYKLFNMWHFSLLAAICIAHSVEVIHFFSSETILLIRVKSPVVSSQGLCSKQDRWQQSVPNMQNACLPQRASESSGGHTFFPSQGHFSWFCRFWTTLLNYSKHCRIMPSRKVCFSPPFTWFEPFTPKPQARVSRVAKMRGRAECCYHAPPILNPHPLLSPLTVIGPFF